MSCMSFQLTLHIQFPLGPGRHSPFPDYADNMSQECQEIVKACHRRQVEAKSSPQLFMNPLFKRTVYLVSCPRKSTGDKCGVARKDVFC
jgi:hypothetical protein